MFAQIFGFFQKNGQGKGARNDSAMRDGSELDGPGKQRRLGGLHRLWGAIKKAWGKRFGKKRNAKVTPCVETKEVEQKREKSDVEQVLKEFFSGRDTVSLSTIAEELQSVDCFWDDESDDGIDFYREGEEFLSCINLLFAREMSGLEMVIDWSQ